MRGMSVIRNANAKLLLERLISWKREVRVRNVPSITPPGTKTTKEQKGAISKWLVSSTFIFMFDTLPLRVFVLFFGVFSSSLESSLANLTFTIISSVVDVVAIDDVVVCVCGYVCCGKFGFCFA